MTCQTYYLLKKNILSIRDNKLITILEFVWPWIFAALIYALRVAIQKQYIPETTYVNDYYQINDLTNIKNCDASIRGGVVALVPNNSFTNSIQTALGTSYTYQYFNSNSELENYIASSQYGKALSTICFAIVFNNIASNNYDYQIRFNTSGKSPQVPDTIDSRTNFYVYQNINNTLNLYANSGFLTLQNLIETLIIQSETSNSSYNSLYKVTSMIVQPHYQDNYSNMQSYLFIYFILPLIVGYLRLVYMLVKQRQDKKRQILLIMGMLNRGYYLSYVIRFILSYLIISVICMVIIQQLVFVNTNLLLLIVWHYMFCLSLMTQSLFISSLFTYSKKALLTATLFFVLNFFVIFLISQNSQISYYMKLISSISPHNAFSLSLQIIMFFEANQSGINWTNLFQGVNNYYFIYSIYSYSFNIFIYAVLFLYFDQVLSRDFGKKRNYFFCFDCFRENNGFDKILPSSQTQIYYQPQNNLQIQAFKLNKFLMITNLIKQYNDQKVVNDLTLNIYQNQLLVLLGPDGSGKSSLISLLSGLEEPDSGSIRIYGLDLKFDYQQIREFTGVAYQTPILFEQLTVKENLSLIYNLKGSEKIQQEQKINQLINRLNLTTKQKQKVKKLSNFEKKILSIGIAFAGDNKFVILDEPTKGIDYKFKTDIWQFIKKQKDEKIVIIASQDHQEAEYLGDKIAIISQGSLKCIGSSSYLKKNYGKGYTLIISKQTSTAKSERIINFVKAHVMQIQVITNITNQITIRIGQPSAPKLATFLSELQKVKKELGIRHISMQSISLEEVYLNAIQLTKKGEKEDNQSDQQQTLKQNRIYPLSQKMQEYKHLPRNPNFCIQVDTLFRMKLRLFFRRTSQMICQVLLPTIIILIGIIVIAMIITVNSPSLIIDDTLYPEGFKVYYGSSSGLASYATNLAAVVPSLNSITSITLNDWQNELYGYKNDYVKGGFFLNVNNSGVLQYYLQCNTVSQDSCPYLINKINNAILRQITNKNTAKITLRNHPLPQSASPFNLYNSSQGFIVILIFTFGLSFFSASIISKLINQRESGCKQQMIVSNLYLGAYWFSSYLLDFLTYIIPCASGPIFCYLFNVWNLYTDVWYATWILFIQYGFASISFVYMLSFGFKNAIKGQIFVIILCIIFGAIFPPIFLNLRMYGTSFISNATTIISYIFRVIPAFSLSYGIINIYYRNLWATMNNTQVQPPFDVNVSFFDAIQLCGITILPWIMILILQHLSRRKIKATPHNNEQNKIIFDADIIQEQYKVKDLLKDKDRLQQCSILINSIRKQYDIHSDQNRVSLQKLSLVLQKGQILGLVGSNDSGKSSLLDILIGKQIQSQGSIWMRGYSLPQQINKIYDIVGYCSQKNSLYDQLTAREHLQIFLKIKGMTAHEFYISRYFDLVGLKGDLSQEMIKDFTPGNKRKLCMAIALLGNPEILLLDQPSTGLDLEEKRVLWDTLNAICVKNKHASILFTTKHIDEAEYLPMKLGYLNHGKLECVGTMNHIKEKYGKDFQLEVRLKQVDNKLVKRLAATLRMSDSVGYNSIPTTLKYLQMEDIVQDVSNSNIAQKMKLNGEINKSIFVENALVMKKAKDLSDFIKSTFKKSETILKSGRYVKFYIQGQDLFRIYFVMQNNREKLGISFYSIKQKALQQIFSDFHRQVKTINPK